MSDIGHEQTDKELKKLEKKITQEYQKATKEVEKKMNDYLSKFAKKDKEMAKKVKNGEITSQEYAEWRQNQMLTGKRWEQMRDTLAQDLVNADKIAAGMINDTLPDAYALNFNYGTYEVESGAEINTSFTLYDHDTVERLMREDPKIIPKARIDIPKDQLWNRQKITSAVTQGILQGESIDKIAKRLGKVTDMDRNAAIRNARTYTTAAENGGRIDSYERANKQGIQVNKMWMATLDDRTRYEHRHLDGVSIPNDEAFEIDGYKIDYPGDPDAEPEMIYNCRCTLVADIKGIDYNDERNDSKLGEMTYDEWKHALDKRVAPGGTEEDEATNTTTEAEKTNVEAHTIVEGKDLTGTWERRPEQFDFEIEDVMNAQGFDGLPQVVTPEEFDKAVKEANGGLGFIAQRTYSAPDQETLEAYRESLYTDKWYVDCSTGGSAHGQGMYTAGNYEGKITREMRYEMDFYRNLNESAYSGSPEATTEEKEEFIHNYVDNLIKIGDIPEENREAAEIYMKNFVPGLRTEETEEAWFEAGGKLGTNELRADLQHEALENVVNLRSGNSYTETFTLDPSAKIIDEKTLEEEKDKFNAQYSYSKLMGEARTEILESQGIEMNADYRKAFYLYEHATTPAGRAQLSKIEQKLGIDSDYLYEINRQASKVYHEKDKKVYDNGIFAALKGYDAIRTTYGTAGADTIVLNRTKLIIKGD